MFVRGLIQWVKTELQIDAEGEGFNNSRSEGSQCALVMQSQSKQFAALGYSVEQVAYLQRRR